MIDKLPDPTEYDLQRAQRLEDGIPVLAIKINELISAFNELEKTIELLASPSVCSKHRVRTPGCDICYPGIKII